METPPIKATATIRRVESSLPAERHDSVAASAIKVSTAAGISQPVPRINPIDMAIGTCSQSTASKTLLVVSRNLAKSLLSALLSASLSVLIPSPPKPHFETQAATACGSIASQAPASCSRASPSCPSGRTTRSDGIAVTLTIAAPAEAAAVIACSAPHQGGKATATTSAPGRACRASPAITSQLAASKPAAFSQTGHRDVEMDFPRSMQAKIPRGGLTAREDQRPEFYGEATACQAAGTGKAVTDLIFSIAKRDVTFLSGTAPISFL